MDSETSNPRIVNLKIAELRVSKDPVVFCTVLGSCVSVCLFSPAAKAGGIIHYALPDLPSEKTVDSLRYGDYAIQALIEAMVRQTRTHASSLVAKLAGGANGIASELPSQRVGDANVALARRLLAKAGIRIVGEDVGGEIGRKVLFHSQTGRLQIARVGPGYTRPSASKAASS